MTTGSEDGPASLYGPVSLALGVLALLGAVSAGFLGIAIPLLSGSLAVTFGLLGLGRGVARGRCAVGLATGALGVLYPVLLVGFLGV
ncbi:hypothetical protein LUX01_18155 [Streptomyces sudanensis]|uniref:hypothetical protein n=1 Tax=Streptomyces sudanensis TaxID=436397 RepID=UPI0020CC7428|nr:hypothetical protein [Streptomyces sudanensis]MCP9988321.1 hypothetical protein [Streptomyces sudanensis]